MLQNQSSFLNYVAVFQALLCYYIRVYRGHFGEREMFVATADQVKHLNLALGIGDRLVALRYPTTEETSGVVGEEAPSNRVDPDPEQVRDLEIELDLHLSHFWVSLVYHRLKQAYDSAIVSFCAIRSTIINPQEDTVTFTSESRVSGLLSKLIYCCQLIILQDAHDIREFQELDDIEGPLKQICQQWLVNDTRGPISVMSN